MKNINIYGTLRILIYNSWLLSMLIFFPIVLESGDEDYYP